MEFRRSIIVDNETPLADGVQTYDLPVSPLSHLNLTLQGINTAAAEATRTQILAMITNIAVIHRGTNIINMSAEDLYVLNTLLFHRLPLVYQQVVAINSVRFIPLIVPMGRKVFDPAECFPETKAGELQLQLTVDVDPAAITGPIIQVEAVELPDAHPTRHLKATTIASTFADTGPADIDLPIQNLYAGILLWSSITPTTVSWNTVLDKLKLLADNTEKLFSQANWESLRGDMLWRFPWDPGVIAAHGHDTLSCWAYMDFDPLENDNFLLDSKPLSALKLRVEVGVAGTARTIPLELHPV